MSYSKVDYSMREACWTCRSRSIQCDQSHVPCTKCEKAGLECFSKRPFRWVKGVAIRGKMRGHSYERLIRASDPAGAIQLTQKKFSRSLAKFGALARSLPAALQDPSISNLDRVSRYYIDYYNKRICKLFIVYDSDSNPFRSLLPYGLEDSSLQKAILALAARHHANTGQSFDQPNTLTHPRFVKAQNDALLFKAQAIEELYRVLSNAQLCRKDTTAATAFLLIFLDLLESGNDGWNFHLEGAKRLIAFHQSLLETNTSVIDSSGETMQGIKWFITRQIHTIEILGAAFAHPKSVSEFNVPNYEAMQHQESIVRAFLGCPEYLLGAIQFLSNQRDIIAGSKLPDNVTVHTHIQNTLTMLGLVQSFDSLKWASSSQQFKRPSAEEIRNLCNLSQAYKIGALLYGGQVLDALTTEISVKDHLVSQLLDLIDSLKDDAPLFKCVLWPLVMVGFECWSRPQRSFVIESLKKLWTLTSCLNVINAAKILQDHWKQEKGPENSVQWQWLFAISSLGSNWLLI